MTFIHPALLTGLLLIGVPVLLHLILRQQPKRLPFPAMRFLQRKATANRRRMRLRHLLLLLLRIFLVALMCLALARPRIVSEALSLGGDRPAAVVIVVDTSPSMSYTVAGRTRLDEAKVRAQELLANFPAGSRFAILDPAEPGGSFLPSLSAARERIANREISYLAGPVTDGVAAAYRLFAELAAEPMDAEGPPPRFIYVVTDRTPACWDASRTDVLNAARKSLEDPKPDQVLIDVGLDKPVDVALTEMRLKPQIIPANLPVNIPITVQATGQDVDTQVQCRIDGFAEVDTKPVQLAAGQSKEVVFTRHGLKPGRYRAEVRLAADDAIPADNIIYITVEVTTPRPILVICDRKSDAADFVLAVKSLFPCEVRTADDPWVRAASPVDLALYRAVALISVSAPARAGLWEKLAAYVDGGGGLFILPGGDELQRADYSPAISRGLMPAQLSEYVSAPDDGVAWLEYQYQHPLMAPWRGFAEDPTSGLTKQPPRAFKYWATAPVDGALSLVKYADKHRHPAILETAFDRTKVRGRVLMLTSPFDNRRDANDRPPNNYWQEWYGFVLARQCVQYLAGSDADTELNFPAGRAVTLPLPAGLHAPAFTLNGPGVDAVIPKPAKGGDLRLMQPQQPGHYTLTSSDRGWSAGFSLNAPAAEFQLLPRVPAATIAAVFGPDSIVAADKPVPLKEKLDQRYRQPMELFPWLMVLLLLILAVENFLANRFYRKPAAEPEEAGRDIMPA